MFSSQVAAKLKPAFSFRFARDINKQKKVKLAGDNFLRGSNFRFLFHRVHILLARSYKSEGVLVNFRYNALGV